MTVLAGALLTLGYAPFGFWPLPFIGLTFWLVVLKKKPELSPWRVGLAFGVGWFGAGVSWVHVSIEQFGGLPLIGSLALMALLVGYLAIFPALFSYALNRWFSSDYWPLAAGLLWLTVEWIRSWFMTGFPWLSLGYSQIDSPLAGWMPIVGETGVAVLVIVMASAFASAVTTRQWIPAFIVAAVLFVSGTILNQISWTTTNGKSASVVMMQGNIKQELRWVPEQDRPTMEKYLAMTRDNLAHDIILWPEAAVPKLEILAQDYLDLLDEEASQQQTALVTGIVNYNFETQEAYNNLIVLGSKNADTVDGHYQYNHSNRYAKNHLLPIGEFIPFESFLRGLAPIFDLPMSSFSRGQYIQENLEANGYKLAPAICFEIAFPHQLRANITHNTDILVTVSNDAWFGDSHGPAQHMEIARVRAKEMGMPLMRGTNTGITAFVDHRGEIQSQLPQFEASALSGKVALVDGRTPYYYVGDLFTWLACAILFGIALWLQKPKHRTHQ